MAPDQVNCAGVRLPSLDRELQTVQSMTLLFTIQPNQRDGIDTTNDFSYASPDDCFAPRLDLLTPARKAVFLVENTDLVWPPARIPSRCGQNTGFWFG